MNTEKILAKMKQNKRNWSMRHLLTVADKFGIPCKNNGSSHYVFTYEGIAENLSVPKVHKDIHPDYITKFLRFVNRVLELQKEKNGSVAQ